MAKKNRVSALAADEAQLTGYASSPIDAGSSGPVSVVLRGASVARIDQIINRLPVTNAQICAENPQLYEITFTAVGGKRANSPLSPAPTRLYPAWHRQRSGCVKES